jgi:hypothetical protein
MRVASRKIWLPRHRLRWITSAKLLCALLQLARLCAIINDVFAVLYSAYANTNPRTFRGYKTELVITDFFHGTR